MHLLKAGPGLGDNGGMPRKDKHGRDVQNFLQYALMRQITLADIGRAIGKGTSTAWRRIREEDFPDAEDCRLLAIHFDLDPVRLMATFGLVEGYPAYEVTEVR